MGQKCSVACGTAINNVSQTIENEGEYVGSRLKILFLDVDGVLHPSSGPEEFSRSCMDLLVQIIQATGAEIVLSTSWRLVPFAKQVLEERLRGLGLRQPIGCTPEVVRYGSKEMWKFLGLKLALRPVEIETWLAENTQLVDFPRWVAIDDIDMTRELSPHMVRTDKHTGLTKKEALRAIRKLNSDEQCDCNICNPPALTVC